MTSFPDCFLSTGGHIIAWSKSASEMLLGNCIQCHQDTCFPPTFTSLSSKPDEQTAPLLGTAVYVRNFGAGVKSRHRTVRSTAAVQIVTAKTPAGLVRRHVDQVHVRHSTTPRALHHNQANDENAAHSVKSTQVNTRKQ